MSRTIGKTLGTFVSVLEIKRAKFRKPSILKTTNEPKSTDRFLSVVAKIVKHSPTEFLGYSPDSRFRKNNQGPSAVSTSKSIN